MQKSLFRQEAMDNVKKGQVITRGTLCTATFVLGEERPANLVLPSSAG